MVKLVPETLAASSILRSKLITLPRPSWFSHPPLPRPPPQQQQQQRQQLLKQLFHVEIQTTPSVYSWNQEKLSIGSRRRRKKEVRLVGTSETWKWQKQHAPEPFKPSPPFVRESVAGWDLTLNSESKDFSNLSVRKLRVGCTQEVLLPVVAALLLAPHSSAQPPSENACLDDDDDDEDDDDGLVSSALSRWDFLSIAATSKPTAVLRGNGFPRTLTRTHVLRSTQLTQVVEPKEGIYLTVALENVCPWMCVCWLVGWLAEELENGCCPGCFRYTTYFTRCERKSEEDGEVFWSDSWFVIGLNLPLKGPIQPPSLLTFLTMVLKGKKIQAWLWTLLQLVQRGWNCHESYLTSLTLETNWTTRLKDGLMDQKYIHFLLERFSNSFLVGEQQLSRFKIC